MHSLNIYNETVYFRDIKLQDLPLVLKWYNKVDDFKFATGIDTPLTLEMLTKKYAEVAICSNEFFVGIHDAAEQQMIGILKGRLEPKNKFSVWISSIAIDSMHQNKGLGTAAVNLLLEFLKTSHKIQYVYLAVIEENEQGRSFWIKLGFNELRKIENHLMLQNKPQNVILMHKQL